MPSNYPEFVFLTPTQYQSYGDMLSRSGGMTRSGAGGQALTDPNGQVSGYNVPGASYTQHYQSMSGLRGFDTSSLPDPYARQTAQAPAQPLVNQIATPQKPPSYAEFAQQFAQRPSPVVYQGGSAPGGMNAGDAAILQNIYSPKAQSPGLAQLLTPPAQKAAGGFVAPMEAGQAFADGGMPTGGQMGSWYTRRQAAEASRMDSGLFKSQVPGRTDKLETLVPAGSYVMPADVVSGLGQGNTMAGSAVLDKMFGTGPFGMKLPRMGGQNTMPRPPGAPAPRAAGGRNDSEVPIIAAGGEYLISPAAVKRLGGGDMKRGHKILDAFVLHARKSTVKEMSKLPGPKKGGK